jgi:hypothetical protein
MSLLRTLRYKLARTRRLLKSLWWLFINVGYLLVILLVSFFLFTVPAQTDDFIYVFLQDFEFWYIVAVYLTLSIWCFITWYSGCINLQVDPVRPSLKQKESNEHIWWSLLIPRILGVTPCLIMGFAFYSASNVSNNYNKIFHLIGIAFTAVIAWIAFVKMDRRSAITSTVKAKSKDLNMNPYKHPPGFRAFLKYLWSVQRIGKWPSLGQVDAFKKHTKQDPTFFQELIFIVQFEYVLFFFLWMGCFCLLLTLLMCIPWINLALSTWLRPGAILIISLACFTLLFTIIAYFHDYSRRPFGFIVLFFVLVFSYLNDNTSLNYLQNNYVAKRQTVNKVFETWLTTKKADWQVKNPGKVMPIVFVAAQGGGIRGLSWTTRTLNYLDSAYDGFLNQTFVISGVSGGGVGATAYLSWLHDQQDTSFVSSHKQFDSFTKQDFLSPLTAAFAFGDYFQHFLPFPVRSLERSKILGLTWERCYKECLGKDSFSESFLKMWYSENNFNYNLPSLILNGTLAENGQRVVTSNLNVAASKWFGDDIDFFDFTKRDINRSFAALNCSRFPFITSGGLMKQGIDRKGHIVDGKRKGHIVDGGYRENTGLQSLLNVFCSIRERLKPEAGIRVIVLYLQNGIDERNDKVHASRVFQDLLVPLQGLVQVNGSGLPAKSIVQFVDQTFDRSINAAVDFHVLSLEKGRDSTKIKLPLGWYMSAVVSEEIDKRVKHIPTVDTAMTRSFSKLFPRMK